MMMRTDDLFRQPERWARVIGWATLAGVEIGLLGPFGSYASNVATRVSYWTALFWIGSLLIWPSIVFAIRLGSRSGLPPHYSILLLVPLACIPLAGLGAIETYLYWPARAASIDMFEWYGFTLTIALPAAAGLMWLEFGKASSLRSIMWGRTGASDTAGYRAAAASSVANVPDHLLANAICLQMEDHHVRIHLQTRSYLHFAVFRDILSQMEAGNGLQVHRSWWVARSAVVHWGRNGRSIFLVLSNGLHVPVARNRIAILRESGWLESGLVGATG